MNKKVEELVKWGETVCGNDRHLFPLLKKRHCIECWQSILKHFELEVNDGKPN